MTSTYILLLTIIVLLAWHYFVQPALISPLSRVSAPNASAHVSNLWILYIRWRNVQNQTLLDIHNRLGPVVRIAPNELSVNSIEGLKTIYGKGFAKDEFYVRRFTNYGPPHMFIMTDNTQHGIRRRMSAHVFSKSNILSSPGLHVSARSILYDRVLPTVLDIAESGNPTDVYRLNLAYAMDFFTSFQFGLKLGSDLLIDTEKRDWYIENFLSRRPWFFWVDHCPGLIKFLQRYANWLLPHGIAVRYAEPADWMLEKCDRAEKLVAGGEQIALGEEPTIFKTYRAQMREQGIGSGDASQSGPLYRLDLASEMFDHSFAAMETSGDTLTFAFYELSRRPELQDQLRTCLLQLEPPIKLPQPGQEAQLPSFKALDDIPLLSAVLQETLRRWPAAPGPQPRVTPADSCSIAGYANIPPNTKVSSSPFVLHKNSDVFPDPETWDHTRWLNASEQQRIEMNKWFWAFSSGPKMCIGSNFAMNAIKLMIAAVYSNFTTSLVADEDMVQDEGLTAGPKSEQLVLRFHPVLS